ncbi:UDP-N-acetylglucosamine--undecaprenyl-phosphate N-acetylglucosaminephosphotransferase [Rheinheimera baltica]|uniref:UDP-N-acetylglucosamine--undecaprenyl-phosphate N-acetylglucosaminephosphotransferase n=1 Tax=Rheinheimera baltica TaxID=67576 RepID=UPI0027400302|nr:UDP-N-acetylglucosamine--undecaprenyl-phosphate N-acetylglucosaminephosphotransferase [Rheinheimera baltica]MDP5189840.1 UDP-N-acetylglucosamine--undecaprenyl-phosphate N-acetylglucosaminephosphotransferase [Rheinheimera baltica]
MPESLLMYVVSFIASCLAIGILYPLSVRVGLVDIPRGRKQHQGAVPLIGGIATYCGLAIAMLWFADGAIEPLYYLTCAGVIVILGAFDDYLDLSVKLRLAVQTLIGLAMTFSLDLHLASLGNLFGFGQVELGPLGLPITLLAVIATINAFNMTDGIDGLAGMLSLVSFSSIAIFMSLWGQQHYAVMALVIVLAMLPYLACNLHVIPARRIFLGDAGSMLIGLSVIWLLIIGTQSESASFRPVTALWIIAIPLMDMIAIMVRRIRKGQSPFQADREHLHHISLRLGLSSRESLALITALACIFACFGIIGEYLLIPEGVMLTLFLLLFAGYLYLLQHIWRIISHIRRQRLQHSRPKVVK